MLRGDMQIFALVAHPAAHNGQHKRLHTDYKAANKMIGVRRLGQQSTTRARGAER